MSDNDSDEDTSPEHNRPWQLPFELGDNGLAPDQRQETLTSFREYIERQVHSFLGYQANQHAEYSTQLSWMLDHHVNNLGDPFVPGHFTVNSKAFERDVLDYYARLWHANSPHSADDGDSYWGYVLSMGSTEGNLYGLWNARDYLKGKALIRDPKDPAQLLWVSAISASRLDADDLAGEGDAQQYREPVAFYSADTHYSLTKAVRVLGIPTFAEIGDKCYPHECPLEGFRDKWPAEVPSLDGDHGFGSIDVDKLCTLVEFFASRGHPALINLNLGTTFKGAYDPVAKIEPRIVKIMKDHNMYDLVWRLPHDQTSTRRGFWIHVDGALAAAYLPYLQMAKKAGITGAAALPDIPEFDFGIEHMFSIVVSGHKWIGAPWPCGIYMTKVKYQLQPPDDPVYITGSPDTTFAGSRDGFASVVLWEHLARYSHVEQMKRATAAQDLADYAVRALTELGKELHRDLHVARTPLSLTVRFLKPVDPLVFKYSLSTEAYLGEQGIVYAHLFVMPGVTRELIDRFIDDLRKPGAFGPPKSATPAAVSARAVSDLTDVPEVSAPVPATAVPLVGRGFQ